MKNYSIKKSFDDVASKSFSSSVETLDFSENAESADKINKWVELETNGKIGELIKSDILDGDLRMVIVSAMFFRGYWTHPFDPKSSFKAPFYLNDEDTVQVGFMKLEKRIKYGELKKLEASAIELPYKDSDLSMVFILPNTNTGLADLEEKLHAIDFEETFKELSSKQVDFEIPKFKIEFDIELKEALSEV